MLEEPLVEVPAGTDVVFRATFSDAEGGTGVSTACTWKFRNGVDGDVSTVSSPSGAITNPSENVWTCRHNLATAGRWFVECKSTAGLGATVSGHAIAYQSAFD